MLSSFLNVNALPVPMLRHVFLDPPEVSFSHEDFHFFMKIQKNKVSGSTFSHVFIDILPPD